MDLGKYCSENPDKGTEIDCLQDNYDKLTDDCQRSVVAVTEREADDIGEQRVLIVFFGQPFPLYLCATYAPSRKMFRYHRNGSTFGESLQQSDDEILQ